MSAFQLRAMLAVAAMNPAVDTHEARRAIAWALNLGAKDVRPMEGFLVFRAEEWAVPADAFERCVASVRAKGGADGEARAYATALVNTCKAMAAAGAWNEPDAEQRFETLMGERALVHAADLIAVARVNGKIPTRKRGRA